MTDPSRNEKSLPILTALSGAMLLASLGISIATVALPTLTNAFSAPVSSVQWVVLAYLVTATVATVPAGRLGDILGHRRVLVCGLMLFTGASLICATAESLAVLIAARAIQGVAGAILMALPLSIARSVVARDRIGSAMGLLGTMSAIGTALGPSMGGILITALGWQSAFAVLALSGSVVLGLALWAIPAGPKPETAGGRQMDWPGTVLLAAALGLYALATTGGKAGVPGESGLLFFFAALAFAAFFIAETKTRAPLVPITLLRDRFTGISLAMNLLMGTVMMATLVVGPFFLSFVLNLNSAMTGLVMAVGPVTAALAGIPAGRITDRFGTRRALAAGLAGTTAGLVCLAFLPRVFGVSGYIAALIILTPGFQLFLAANNTAVMAAAADEQRGMLSGLLGLSRNLGLMTGASVMAALFAAAIGPLPAGEAPANTVGDAFTATFLAAAGLAAIAGGLAFFARPARKAMPASGSGPA